MGYTSYSSASYTNTANALSNLTQREIFSNDIHQSMDPNGMEPRECRDSEAHPNSLPIIIGLDVTGSMGYIPEYIVKKGLGKMIESITKPDPAICFVAIGDDSYDSAPLQVGQFESGDQELLMWLQRTWLEGGGGGNLSESYHLAWEVARQALTDNWEKRKQKGYLITIGDESPYDRINDMSKVFGKPSQIVTTKELYDMIKDQWHVYHIHANDGSYNTRNSVGVNIVNHWKSLIGNGNVIVVENHIDIPTTIASIINTPASIDDLTKGRDTNNPKEIKML